MNDTGEQDGKISGASASNNTKEQSQSGLAAVTESFAGLFRHSADAVMLLDSKGVVLAASEKTRRITKKEPSELPGENFFRMVSKESSIPLQSAYESLCINEDGFFEQILKIVRPDGTLLYLNSIFHNQLHSPGIGGVVLHLRLPPVKITKRLRRIRDVSFPTGTESRLSDPAIAEAYYASAEKYQRLVEHSLEGIGMSKGDKIVYANTRLLNIFGYDSIEEMAAKPLQQHIAPESLDYVQEQYARLSEADGEAINFQYKIVRKDGEKRDVEISVAAVNINGEEYLQSAFQDVTDVKLAQRILKESEQRFNLIFKESPVAFIISTYGNGKIVEINDAALSISGFKREEVLGKNLFALGVSFDKRIWQDIDETRRTEGVVRGREFSFKRKDGSRLWVLFNSEVIELNNEKHYLTVVMDITPRKQMEQELRKKEQAYRSLYENSFSGIYRSKPDGTLLMANKALPPMLGYSSFEEISKYKTTEFYVDPDEHTDFIEQVSSYGEVQDFELRLRRKDGTIGRFRESARAVFNSDREIEYLEGILEDVTSIRLYEEKLSSLNEELERRVAERTAELNVLTARAPIPIGFFNAASKLVEANPAWREFVEKWKYEEELSNLLKYLRETCVIEKQSLEYLYRQGGEIRLQPLLLPAHGESNEVTPGRTVVITLYSLENSAGKVDRIACLIEDITEHLKVAKTQRELKLHKYYSALILESLEDERKRLSRELHDVIGHNLLLLKLKLEIYQKSHELNDKEFSGLLNMISLATSEIGALSKNLRPEVLDNYGLQRSLQIMTDEMEELSGVAFSLNVDQETEMLDENMKLNIYRIVQEAVSNISKHAEATAAEIRIVTEQGQVVGCIRDDGRGFNSEDAPAGRGSIHMHERAQMLGGSLEIQSAENSGTKLSFTVPIRSCQKS